MLHKYTQRGMNEVSGLKKNHATILEQYISVLSGKKEGLK